MSDTMKAAQHTPGPWRFDQSTGGRWYVYGAGASQPFKPNVYVPKTGGTKEVFANAYLIAAAPELLYEICKLPCGECGHDLDRHLDEYGCEFDRGDREGDEGEPDQAMGPCSCRGGEYDKKLIALIAKARGGR